MMTGNETLTPRESILMEAEKEESRLAREHEVTIRTLELGSAAELRELELALKQEEARLRRIPLLLLRLPLLPFMGLVLLFTIPLGREVPEAFWELLR